MENTNIYNPFYLVGAEPLDAKTKPVASVSDLGAVATSDRYEGMVVTVLNDGYPIDFQLVGGTKNYNWRVKFANIYPTFAKLEETVDYVVNNFKTSKNPSKAFVVGTEVLIQSDENNGDKLTKYWLVGFNEDGSLKWEQEGNKVTVDGSDIEQ